MLYRIMLAAALTFVFCAAQAPKQPSKAVAKKTATKTAKRAALGGKGTESQPRMQKQRQGSRQKAAIPSEDDWEDPGGTRPPPPPPPPPPPTPTLEQRVSALEYAARSHGWEL